MPYKDKEERKEYYQKNKDEINRKRREHDNLPEVRKRISDRDKKWRSKNRDKINRNNKIYKKKYDNKNKELVFNHYGRECSCCGEKEITFLSIDHIDGNGTKHRKKIQNGTYRWLVRNNFPKEFQTLCFNCNWGRYKNKGICPHKLKK